MADPVQTVRQVYRAFNRGDIDALVAHLAPDVRWFTLDLTLNPRLCLGREEVGSFLSTLLRDFVDFQVEPEQLLGAEDLVFARLLLMGRHHTGGTTTRFPVGHLWAVRDGSVRWHRLYLDPERARRMLERRSAPTYV